MFHRVGLCVQQQTVLLGGRRPLKGSGARCRRSHLRSTATHLPSKHLPFSLLYRWRRFGRIRFLSFASPCAIWSRKRSSTSQATGRPTLSAYFIPVHLSFSLPHNYNLALSSFSTFNETRTIARSLSLVIPDCHANP